MHMLLSASFELLALQSTWMLRKLLNVWCVRSVAALKLCSLAIDKVDAYEGLCRLTSAIDNGTTASFQAPMHTTMVAQVAGSLGHLGLVDTTSYLRPRPWSEVAPSAYLWLHLTHMRCKLSPISSGLTDLLL